MYDFHGVCNINIMIYSYILVLFYKLTCTHPSEQIPKKMNSSIQVFAALFYKGMYKINIDSEHYYV